ncbi:MAG: DUF4301 family protein, partial [Deltaproteobacteria bacterium]
FVPASGVASRMFADWQSALISGGFSSHEKKKFLDEIKKYPFYSHLQQIQNSDGANIEALITQGRDVELLKLILTPKGLDYLNMPKAMIVFHRYAKSARSALEEHLAEATHYAKDDNGICRLHFTVSEEHLDTVRSFLDKIMPRCEQVFNAKFLVNISTQSLSTDTITVDENGEPTRDADGKLIFRAGGHGALLENLQRISEPIIFIKNIDNITHESRIATTIKYKKALAGYLIKLRNVSRDYQAVLAGNPSDEKITEIKTFCERMLNHRFDEEFIQANKNKRAKILFSALNRPLRVCGVVKNEGEPGGAPLWIKGINGRENVQIVESFQVNHENEEQESIWRKAEFFNPVDIVCSIRDAQGNAFNLNEFANQKAISVTIKRDGTRMIKVLELPGLWNGAMAYWNTAFVEVPIATFNPVKTIDDLLRDAHQQIV